MTSTTPVHDRRSVAQALTDCQMTTLPALRAAVDTLPGPMRRVAGYHLGWLDESGQPATAPAGKLIRPALALLAARAVGGRAQDALPEAVAVELVHNFSLLHDDVMDDDRTRRHRPTAWAVFGVGAAVLAGDALWALALQVLADTGPRSGRSMPLLAGVLRRLMDGQCADTDFPTRPRVSVAECLDMAAGKTGALVGCACALGALAGGGTAEQVACLRGMGECLGMAFQLVDDLLGIWGDPSRTGKPVGSDLVHRKKSLPVVAALHSATPAGAALAALYRLDRALTHDERVRAASLVDAAGGRAWAQQQAEHHHDHALRLLRRAEPVPALAAQLAGVADMITRRER